MKLQLDTTNKTIKLEERIKLSDLIDTLKKILPEEWQEFSLETNVVINNWSNPVIVYRQYPTYPQYPWYNTGVATNVIGDGNSNYLTTQGTYNIEIK